MIVWNSKQVRNDIAERLQKLQTFTSTNGNGVTRLPFSPEAKKAAEYLKQEMEHAGMEARIDLVGNVRGVLKASPAYWDSAKTIIIGSHYDTVKNGGAYDGIAGVVCGISIAEAIASDDEEYPYNLEIIAFNDEEGCMFGSGCLGSKSLTGEVNQEYLEHLTDENGISIKEWMVRWGSDPKKIAGQKLDLEKIRGYFEIHIEQGPVLEHEKYELGIVDGIVGLLRCMVTLTGRTDHAGTTPMEMREDTILLASKVISQLDRIAQEEKFAVATCGFIRAYPNAMNVIAGKTEFTLDLRAPKDTTVDTMYHKVVQLLEQYTKEAGAIYEIDIKLRQPAVTMSRTFVDGLCKKCEDHKINSRKITSGAAHDAMVFAPKVDTAMVFVPSHNGRSHCPEEFSRHEDLEKAAHMVYEEVCAI